MATGGGLETLLDLNGHIIEQGAGYWVKIEVRKLTRSTAERPHGIKYSLTLHDPEGNRILGYDNAHAIPSRSGAIPGTRFRFDHRHRYGTSRVIPYEFTSAWQLLSDFFDDVDSVLKEIRNIPP